MKIKKGKPFFLPKKIMVLVYKWRELSQYETMTLALLTLLVIVALLCSCKSGHSTVAFNSVLQTNSESHISEFRAASVDCSFNFSGQRLYREV